MKEDIPEEEFSSIFQTRAKIIKNEKNNITFEPPIDQWKKYCICKTP